MSSAQIPLEKVWLAWSSGKDSAWALHILRRRADCTARDDGLGPAMKVVGLLTTVTSAYERVSMHGVREGLLVKQAEAAGLPVRPWSFVRTAPTPSMRSSWSGPWPTPVPKG